MMHFFAGGVKNRSTFQKSVANSTLAVISWILCLVAFTSVKAAEITCVSNGFGPMYADGVLSRVLPRQGTRDSCVGLRITGPIVQGNYEKFQQILAANEPFVEFVSLYSEGGSISEAVAIGNLIRERSIGTRAATQPGFAFEYDRWTCRGDACICASSCFLIWAAGINRLGDFIGLHRPYDVTGRIETGSLLDADLLYQRVLSDLESYLLKNDVPVSYVEAMVSNSSRDLYIPLPESVSRDLAGFQPYVEEWAASTCGLLTSQEQDLVTEFRIRDHTGWNPQPEHISGLKVLEARALDIERCTNEKLRGERKALYEWTPLAKR